MADVVIGIAASHAPNLANPALMTGGKEAQYAAVKAGFAQARTLLEQAQPGCDRDLFYRRMPPRSTC